MSRQNVEIAIQALKAAMRRPKQDFETINRLYDPDHVLVPIEATKLGGGEARGAAGYRAWLDDSGVAMPFDAVLEGAVDVGTDTVLAVTTNHFHAPRSGLEIEQRFWLVMTVVDGKVTRTEAYLSPGEAIDAVRIGRP